MALKGDFIGFTFNGIHSSTLGIIRTSNGSRYNSNLLPNSQDQTVAVPGGDGAYFFGSNYTTRVFQLQIASDELDEAKLAAIRQWLGDKQIHELIFDEVPYKVYMAKCTNMPQFNFICFGARGERIYKGEGSIEFTCYYPYARSRYKWLDDYTKGNINEWNGDEYIADNSLGMHNHVLLSPEFVATDDTERVEGKTYYIKQNNEYQIYYGDFVEGVTYYEVARIAAPYKVNGYNNKPEWADASGMLKNNNDSLGYVTWPWGYSSLITVENVRHDFVKSLKSLWVKNGTIYNSLPSDADFDDYFEIVNNELQRKEGAPIVYFKRLFDTAQWTRGGNAYSRMLVYNPGDIPADYQLLFRSHKDVNRIYFYKTQKIDNVSTSVVLYKIYFDFTGNDIPNYMLMDSKTELLTGYNYDSTLEQYVPDNKIYNKCITKGDFFKIPLTIPNECYNMRFVLGVKENSTYEAQFTNITYNYLYY